MWDINSNKKFDKYTALSSKNVLSKLETSKTGLTNQQVEKRLKISGKNELKKTKNFSAFKLLLSQFTNPLVVVLLIAAGISYIASGEGLDAPLILIIVIFNAAIGFKQEYSAEKIIESLKKMASPHAKVIRNKKIKDIESKYIVPGDIVILEAGDIVPADLRIIECHNFYVLESVLTGESKPIEKTEKNGKANLITQAKNMVFSGTVVTKGKAYAVAVSTGNNTELGRIAKIMEETETEIPLMKKLRELSLGLSLITLGIILAVFFIGVYYNYDLLTMFMIAVSLGVAAIPEGLPVVVTIALALGIKKIADHKALIRKMPAIETLGSVNTVFLDKTGTITKNEMTVIEAVLPTGRFDISGIGYSSEGTFTGKASKRDLKEMMACAYICNDAEHRDVYSGDPTEIALVVVAEKYMKQFSDVLPHRKRIRTIEFSSERKMMSVLSGKQYTKGAPEKIINLCDKVLIQGHVKKFDKEMKNKMIKESERLMYDAMRVLAFAYKDTKNIKEDKMIFVGFCGMIDPPRAEVDKAVLQAINAGISVKMITGDHAITAKAVGKMIGLGEEPLVITGLEIDKMLKEKNPLVEKADIFARVTPQQKIDIIDYYEKQGYTCAMTGDGVNDAPALKRASMGIAVAEATDVAKEASQMILLKTHFKTILDAIKLGRGIMDNIRKFILYLLTCNIAEVGVVALSTFFRFPLPLTAIQLLWINLVTDGPPAIALALDPPAKDIMSRKPEGKKTGIITKPMKQKIISMSLLMIILIMFLISYAVKSSKEYYLTTMVFTALVMFEIVRVFSVRKEFGQPFFNNKWVLLGLMFALIIQIIIIYTPIPSNPFNVTPLNIGDWIILILLSITLFASDLAVGRLHKTISTSTHRLKADGKNNLKV